MVIGTSSADAVRAWKSPAYRRRLSDQQREALPAHPAGSVELRDERLSAIGAGKGGAFTVAPWCFTQDCQTAIASGNCCYGPIPLP